MRRTIMTLLCVAFMATAAASEKVEATLGADLVSQYIWRGMALGNVSLQPTLGASYKEFSLSAWGNVGIEAADTKELDLTLTYAHKGFHAAVTDYWFSEDSYFRYRNNATSHIWEANVGYDFGVLAVQWFTNFAGNDGTYNGKRAYSSYCELSAPFRLADLDWTATLGAVPYATTLYGANGFCVTNVALRATKNFVIKQKYRMPVFVGLTCNPRSEKLYLVFGTSFAI
ncbi:MAG: hypothetical protein II600_07155 [Bacteroidaceae bacterium]|nr:hypothetical protein [Bacteroidaceae bacterium]